MLHPSFHFRGVPWPGETISAGVLGLVFSRGIMAEVRTSRPVETCSSLTPDLLTTSRSSSSQIEALIAVTRLFEELK